MRPILLFAVLALLAGCKKEASLPGYEPGGRSMMAAYINGEAWQATYQPPGLFGGNDTSIMDFGQSSTPAGHRYYILETDKVAGPYLMRFVMTDFEPGVGQTVNFGPEFRFGDYYTRDTAYAVVGDRRIGLEAATGQGLTGWLTVNYQREDTVAQSYEIGGRFAFRASNRAHQTIEVTDGRFFYNSRRRR